MKIKTKELTLIALMTACNTLMELLIGGFLHLINFSMKGSVMIGFNLMVYTLLFARIPRFGIITMCGVCTAFLNLLLTGGSKLFAIYCIGLEALVIDLIIYFGGLKRLSVMAAGVVAGLVACLCSVVNGVIFMGIDPVNMLNRLADSSLVLGHSVVVILMAVLFWRVVVGVAFGALAFKVCKFFKYLE